MNYKSSNKQKVSPIEPACRKTIYNSNEAAQEAIKYLEETTGVKGLSPYHCVICGAWHLTSK